MFTAVERVERRFSAAFAVHVKLPDLRWSFLMTTADPAECANP
jgi:hypothetical protein